MLTLFMTIVVVGLVVWLINTYTPIPQPFKTIILVVGVLFVLFQLLAFFGVSLGGSLHHSR